MENKKKTILLVDDDADYLFQTRMHLQKFGFDVIVAESQKECEELLKTIKKPDLVILDLMMENEDSGFVLSYKIKKQYPGLPIIIATAVTSETRFSFNLNTEEERQWIKADRYLDKGIRPDQLNREINDLLK